MKSLKFVRVFIPMLLMGHCATVAKAQTADAAKEEFRFKMVLQENGKKITIDTVFKSREELENFHKQMVKSHVPLPNEGGHRTIRINKDDEKEVEINNGDTTIKHRVKIVNIGNDSLEDVLHFVPDNENVIKMIEGEIVGIESGADVKMVKIYMVIKLDEPTNEELKNNKNPEINSTLKENILTINNLNVYPNPGNGQLNLDFELAEKGPVQLLVTDVQGKEVYKEEFMSNGSGMQSRKLDLSGQAGGIYLLKIKTGNKSVVKKIVLQEGE